MSHPPEMNISTLVSQFQNQTLPLPAWTHRAHLSVAAWYLMNYSLEEATCYLRSGIITYNNAVGTINSPESGYHETLTLFWIKAVQGFIQKNPGMDIETHCRHFFDSDFGTSAFPLQYYSREVLFSTRARAFWVAPDLKEIDFIL